MLDANKPYPRTLYKPADIARARANIARHAWARKLADGMRERAARYLEMDRERLRSFIAEKTPLLTIQCPSCGSGPWYTFTLIRDGEALQCTDCHTTWEWDPDDRSETWNVQAVLRSLRLDEIVSGLDALGILYQIDGDRRCAEKAAILVERFAEVYPGYRLSRVNRNEWVEGKNDPVWGRIDGWKAREARTVRRVLLAYDLIHDSGALSPEQCERIDRDVVRNARDYFVEGFRTPGERNNPGYSDRVRISPYLSHHSIQDAGPAWWCIAATGALLGDEETLRSILQLYEEMLDPATGIFHADGTFYECTASYQLGLMRQIAGIPEILRGNLDVEIASHPPCQLLRRCYTWYPDAVFPDGTRPAVNDDHVGSRLDIGCSEYAWINWSDRKALRHLQEEWGRDLHGGTEYSLFFRDADAAGTGDGEPYGRESRCLPGIGLMILRHGNGVGPVPGAPGWPVGSGPGGGRPLGGQSSPSAKAAGPEPGAPPGSPIMAFLDHGPYVPVVHKHPDYLNLGLWACGLEMVSEMGYNWNPEWARLWERGPRSHNTVLEVATQEERGRPLIWCITPGPKLAEAGLPPANSRFLALLPRASGLPLLVEIFRVAGDAEAFTWMLHARSDDVALQGVEAWQEVEVAEPLRKGREGRVPGALTATWRFADPEPCGLIVHLPALQSSRAILSECPPEEDVIAATHNPGGTLKSGAALPYRGHLQILRPGPRAIFAAVYLPFAGEAAPPLTVRQHAVAGSAEAVVLEIDDGEERFLLAHWPEPGTLRVDALELDGRAAVAVLRAGRLETLCLAAGTAAAYAEFRVSRASLGNACGIRRGNSFDVLELDPEE